MIELVPMAYRIVNEVDMDTSPSAPIGKEDEGLSGKSRQIGALSATSTGSLAVEGRHAGELVGKAAVRKMDEDEERDAVFYRLETLGYRVGQGLVERYVASFWGLDAWAKTEPLLQTGDILSCISGLLHHISRWL